MNTKIQSTYRNGPGPLGENLTIVMQGHLKVGWDIRNSGSLLKQIFPKCQLILSTYEHELPKVDAAVLQTEQGYGVFDKIIRSHDPGALPDLKMWGQGNNSNRQITTSLAGLRAAETDFAVKLRTDAYLVNTRIVDRWRQFANNPRSSAAIGKDRLLTLSYFTLNPRFDERLSFHVSDWFQMGRTEDVRSYWDIPPYDMLTAVWYEFNPHHEGSFPREREFRAKYAVEQWTNIHYAKRGGSIPISYHNEVSEDVTLAFEQFLADNFVVFHPHDVGFKMPKHDWVFSHAYLNAICYNYIDWAYLAEKYCGFRVELDTFRVWPYTFEEKMDLVRKRNRKMPGWLKDALCLFPSQKRIYR